MTTIDEVRAMTTATIPAQAAADVLGCDPRTVYRGVEDGSVPGLRIGRKIMILRLPFLRMLTGETQEVAA